MRTVDVAIIGAGTAGLSARREVEKLTNNYVVIDDGPLGTTCARVGCMPSKVIIQIANDYHRRTKLLEMGIHGSEHLQLNTKEAMQHVRKLRDRFVRSVNSGIDSWKETHLIRKRAKFIDRNTLDLGDEKIFAKKIILATGSSPIFPKAWQEHKEYFVDTNHFFELDDLPKRMAVIGLGVIGIELGQALARLGVDTKAITLGKKLGGLSDPDLQDYAIKTLSEESNLELSFDGAEVLGPSDNGIKIKSGDKIWEVDKILLAVGRSPNLKNLNLESLDLEFDEKNVPVFHNNTYQIKNSNLYIAGDVNNDRPLLHEAADEGKVAGYNAVREENQCFKRRTFMAVTFSDPNIAIVGKSYDQIAAEKIDIEIGESSFEGQGRAIVMLKEKGLVHIYADKSNGKILGAELIAPHADHIAHLLAWAIDNDMTVEGALNQTYYHPVLEEGIRTAFRSLFSKLYPNENAFGLRPCD